jgi:4-hydroxymandelate oxidase
VTALLRRVDDFEEGALRALRPDVAAFFAGGAGDEWTMAENRRAFDRWVLRPRVLRGVGEADPSTTVIGEPMPFPIAIAPTAFHRLAHPEGELATARAAAATGATMIVSTMSSVSLEDVAACGPPRWFQLYVHRDRELTADLVARAQAAGYTALVLTVDAPRLGRRERDEATGFELPPEVGMANVEHWLAPGTPGTSTRLSYFATQIDPNLTWDDVAWLRTLSPLPIVIKGVMTAEDATIAADAGVAALVVSNHGGRQLDGAGATLDALPEVVGAAAGRLDVLVDGGVRRGQHVLKALGLGAAAVLVGRAPLWGLAVDGEAGVRRVLEILRDEFVLAMSLAGVRSVGEIEPSMVSRAP